MAKTKRPSAGRGNVSKVRKVTAGTRLFQAGRLESNREMKFFDTDLSHTVVANITRLSTGDQLCLIPQGVTESTRVGRKAFIKSIQITGMVRFSGAGGVSGHVKLYLVLDKQANGAVAAPLLVYDNVSFPLALRELSNQSRFQILKTWNLPMETSLESADVEKNVILFKKVNIPIVYTAAAGAITEICCNNIFMMAGSSNSGFTAATFVGTCRLRFTD